MVETTYSAARDGDEFAPTQAQPEPSKSARWPWLVGGCAIGLAIGFASARQVMATREFFRAPGWGWAAADSFAQTVLRVR